MNGAMQVAQRGTSFSYNGFGGANFCVDRFWFYNGGGATSGTIEQSTDVPSGEGFAYSLFNNTNANLPSGTNVELTKQGNAAPFVVGKTYTLSFWVKGSSASSGTTLQVTWRNSHANGTNSTKAVAADPTFDITTSWERVVIPFTLSVSPVSTNNVLDFEYAHHAGAKITGVQLEVGAVATPFEHRSYGEELALCQRYGFRFTGTCGSIVKRNASNIAYCHIHAPQPLRAVPSVVVTTAGAMVTYDSAIDQSLTSFAVSSSDTDPNSAMVQYFCVADGVTTGSVVAHQSMDLFFSAEL
jgi:hypothetical protein